MFMYPLAPVSIPLCTSDGKNRKTAKSKLYDAVMSDMQLLDQNSLPGIPSLETYFLDVVAAIRTITGKVATIRELAWKILQVVPQQFNYIYLVCDTYNDGSIKAGERSARGSGKGYILNSPDMKVPSDFFSFLKNGSNKVMLLNLLEQAIIEDKKRLGSRIVFYANKSHCTRICSSGSIMVLEFASDHEEADTKLIAVAHQANLPTDHSVLVRSPSGDIDILVLFLLHFSQGPRILVNNGTGKARKIIDMSTSPLSLAKRKALAGMHAFSGNDYISSFFRKGKLLVWKKIMAYPEFINTFSDLGNFNYSELERFVCKLYGYPKRNSVNKVRALMFINKFKADNQTIDLCNLAPCAQNMHFHMKRANYISDIYRRCK